MIAILTASSNLLKLFTILDSSWLTTCMWYIILIFNYLNFLTFGPNKGNFFTDVFFFVYAQLYSGIVTNICVNQQVIGKKPTQNNTIKGLKKKNKLF